MKRRAPDSDACPCCGGVMIVADDDCDDDDDLGDWLLDDDETDG